MTICAIGPTRELNCPCPLPFDADEENEGDWANYCSRSAQWQSLYDADRHAMLTRMSRAAVPAGDEEIARIERLGATPSSVIAPPRKGFFCPRCGTGTNRA
jgi:hypothetical protein